MNDKPLPAYLTCQETAAHLNLAPSWVYEQCRLYQRTRGREGIPCKRFGRAVRIPQGALTEWIESR